MPTYEVQLPDGRTLEIDGPRPPTRGQMQSWQARGAFGPAQAPAEAETPTNVFSMEPRTPLQTRAAMEQNTQRVSDVAAEHPYLVGGAAMAAGGAAGLLRAGAAPAATMATRVGAVMKEAITQSTPVAKYEAIRYGLEKIGLPAPVAMSMAMVASGYKRPAKATPAAVASPASPVASSPAVPVPEVAPSAPASPQVPVATRGPSPQMVQNELGIQARRQQVKLSEPQYKAATELVNQGRTPAQAIQEVASRTQATPVTATTTPGPESPASAPKTPKSRGKLTADEADEYLRLTGKGMSHEEAVEALLAQRQLAKKLGTPTPERVRRNVAERNATGRWTPNKDQ